MTRTWTPLTSFVGRAGDTADITRLLDEYRLVTVTGPGGVGKTRLAAEVALRMEGRFPDGMWFIELGPVTDAAHVATEVMSALGIQQHPGTPPLEVLAEALAPRRLLLILDNCEHVLPAVADVCGTLLGSADEVRILATSREQLGMGGERQYRLAPLELPGSDEPAAVSQSAAAALFTERARQADPRFTLDVESAPLVTRVVTGLDGMPLAIELAAARVEALGMAGLAERLDDVLRLLTRKDPLAAERHRSLAAVADWSYQLLAEPEQRAFRRLAVLPGPFTLAAAQSVAGPDAGPIAARLVDCSLLVPPRLGADGRTRYRMLQTLRAYALTRLREAGEEHQTTAAMAAAARSAAKRVAVELEASQDRERDAMRRLDAEDAILSWVLDHDPDGALPLAGALAPWLHYRGRDAEALERLRAAVARSTPASQGWARAHLWLGHILSASYDLAGALGSFTMAIEGYASMEPCYDMVAALVGRAVVRLYRGEAPETVDDARRALTVARGLGDRAAELHALTGLSLTAYFAGDTAEALDWARGAQAILASDVRADEGRWSRYFLATTLTRVGELDLARRLCATGLALARQADDLAHLGALLGTMATLERLAGNLAEARTHLREAADIASRTGVHVVLVNLIEECGYLCAETGRWANAVTLWAAHAADRTRRGLPGETLEHHRRLEYLRRIEQALEPGQLREARERGTMMTLAAAAELIILMTAPAQETAAQQKATGPAPGKLLSPRERELVTLVAQGRTNGEIAALLHISVRTVASHLDRIRDKTGNRRRADLTRLAIEENLV
jgi:predicted ATPase/DNA-binding CsgD family transcriptional regulator